MANKIQTLGYLLKKEKLYSLATETSHPEMLLESMEPYPGFYEEYFVPTHAREQKPKSVFMVLKNFDISHEDDFVRMTMHVKHEHSIKFDAALSTIQLFNEPATTIRVNMDNYSQLTELVAHYKSVGVKFQSAKAVKPYQSLIKIRRFFDVELMDEGIYKDLDKPNTFYLLLDGYLSWDEFERTTISIRNNIEYKTYDAAQAALYAKSGLMDMVRIYDIKATMANLNLLRQKYLSEMSRR